MKTLKPIREGDVFDTVSLDGKTFEIRYGYYEDYERESGEPIPIYPDLKNDPIYGESGKRIVTFIQESCESFESRCDECLDETDCGFCKHYRETHPGILLGICMKDNK